MNGSVKKGVIIIAALGLASGAYGYVDSTYVRATEYEQSQTAVHEKLSHLETMMIETELARIASETFELTERLEREPNNLDIARRLNELAASRSRYERALKTP